jgi:CPA1 family monovalent cation:H+ antiporter
MIVVGMLFGSFIGIVFSKIIEKIKNNEFLEIVLTLILAHTTFILSEVLNHFLLPVSGVIATTLAALVVGNYGRYKISPKVEETMERFWGFFAFVSNSLVFILVGIMIVSLDIDWRVMIIPVIIAIIAAMIARAISIYGVIMPLNWTKAEEYIPLSWQHMLSWGSLR